MVLGVLGAFVLCAFPPARPRARGAAVPPLATGARGARWRAAPGKVGCRTSRLPDYAATLTALCQEFGTRSNACSRGLVAGAQDSASTSAPPPRSVCPVVPVV